jgi:hypothetical protein
MERDRDIERERERVEGLWHMRERGDGEWEGDRYGKGVERVEQ